MTDAVVRGAGAVVSRRGPDGVEVLLVHRAHYDDWSFPKGKCLDGEDDEACALREVAEETDLEIRLGVELPSTSYLSRGRPKRVRYWLADCDGEARPRNEIDEVAWFRPGDAANRLTYDRDREVLRGALTELG